MEDGVEGEERMARVLTPGLEAHQQAKVLLWRSLIQKSKQSPLRTAEYMSSADSIRVHRILKLVA